VYTVFAMGLAGGTPSLTAVPSVDAKVMTTTAAPTTLPVSGGEQNLTLLIVAAAGALMLLGGAALKTRTVRANR
jgi:hypothetical protein